MNMFEKSKEIFWSNKILSEKSKEKIFYYIKSIFKGNANKKDFDNNLIDIYIKQLLSIQKLDNSFSIEYPKLSNSMLKKNDVKLIAYYLPQFYPNKYNDKWWGKGSTEWTNVSKTIPQYIGHYQPRLPGELGYYDLRIQDNIYRQIELAKIYGIYGFCFYYYWFDGIRLLDLPFENFINDKAIDFPFCICWVNESWTKQWSGASNTPLIEISKDINSNKRFIKQIYKLFINRNYIRIDNKPVLIIYKIENIPSLEEVIGYWRSFVKEQIGVDIYIIGIYNKNYIKNKQNLLSKFDAFSEFAPGPQIEYMNDITNEKSYVCKKFYGKVYDYKEFVNNKKYFHIKYQKLYRAITPMWDNTSRRGDKGLILDGATPELYKQWLKDIIIETKNNKNLDDNVIFINAWNEWAEGAYLEPDLKWKYGYLEATKDAIIESRKSEG